LHKIPDGFSSSEVVIRDVSVTMYFQQMPLPVIMVLPVVSSLSLTDFQKFLP